MTRHRNDPLGTQRAQLATRRRVLSALITITAGCIAVAGCGSDGHDAGADAAPSASRPIATDSATVAPTAADGATANANGTSEYCTLYASFAVWSTDQFAAVTAEAATADYTVRDAFFAEQLERIQSMQRVAPAELEAALDVLRDATELYVAHDLAAAAGVMRTDGAVILALNDYGHDECGIDPLAASQG